MIIPTKGSRMAAGHDIYALEDGTIPAQRQMLVDTRIAIGFPKGTYGRLVARASMAVKAAGKCRSVVQGGPECSWSTKGDCGPRGPPGPLRSILIHTFGNFTENVDQGGSGWTRRTRGTITPLVGPGLVFKFCWWTSNSSRQWCYRCGLYRQDKSNNIEPLEYQLGMQGRQPLWHKWLCKRYKCTMSWQSIIWTTLSGELKASAQATSVSNS